MTKQASRPPLPPLPSMVGPYEILRLLTQGGMADVYLACRAGFPVALKVLRPELAARSDLFLEEARLTARLCHPNIVTLHDVAAQDSPRYMALELVQGLSLHQLVCCGPVPVPLAAYIADRLLLGLEHAHERGIVHRDVSSANVLCSSGGHVKLIDFGAASDLYAPGGACGIGSSLLGHIAPEQRDGGGPDVRGDLYSVGVLLAELVTGRPDAALHEPLPPAVERIVRRATRPLPEDRYQDAAAMRAQVSQVPSRRTALLAKELSHLVQQRGTPIEQRAGSAPPLPPGQRAGSAPPLPPAQRQRQTASLTIQATSGRPTASMQIQATSGRPTAPMQIQPSAVRQTAPMQIQAAAASPATPDPKPASAPSTGT